MDDVMIFEQAVNSPFRRVINAQKAVVIGQTLHLIDARVTSLKPTGEFNGGIKSNSVDIALPWARRSISSSTPRKTMPTQ